MRFVNNPIENWFQMAGAGDDQKKLNAVLTEWLFSRQNMPYDECLAEAEMIMSMAEANEEAIANLLVGTFATIASPTSDDLVVLEGRADYCRKIAKELVGVLNGTWPPVFEEAE